MSRSTEITELTDKCDALAEQLKGLNESDFPHLVSRLGQYRSKIQELTAVHPTKAKA